MIVGIADNQHIPEACPASNEKNPCRFSNAWQQAGAPHSREHRPRQRMLEWLCKKTLEDRGIIVDRPGAVDWHQRITTPDFSISSGFGVMPPRDCLLTMGKKHPDGANEL
ncbi:hypothetical protein QW180_31230 [Vibrio sinaloensis]|nr:hypothetical protein [Vibrio sinaloensis]